MSEQASTRVETGAEPHEARRKGSKAITGPDAAPRYEPPRLEVLGSFEELTGQTLKSSGGTDFVSFFS